MILPSAATPVGMLRGATLADGSRVDILLEGELVSDVVPAGTGRPPAYGAILDVEGRVVTAAAAEPHGHLDKAFSWERIDPPHGDLERAIESWHSYAATMTEDDILTRARRAAGLMLAAGITAVRSHVDLLPGPDPLRGVRALVRLRDELSGLMDLELVALGGWTADDEVFEAALDAGVDLVGGAPHLAPDPFGDLDRILAIARRRGVGIDLHTDESLDGAATLAAYARAVAGWDVPRTAGHCVRLSTMDRTELDAVLADVARAGIGVVALPITNLYLQGRGHERSVPRGIAPIRRLRDAGVRVAAGADNIRDPFNPVGRCDPFETASLLVAAAHLSPEEAVAAVTDDARDVMTLPPAGPRAGARADLLAVAAASLGDAVALAPAERIVIHRGRLVSRTTVTVESAAAAPPLATAPIGKASAA